MARLILAAGESYGQLSGTSQVFGTSSGAETITIAGGSAALDASFNRGGDTLIIAGSARDFTARASGSSVIISGGGGGYHNTFRAGRVDRPLR